MGTLWLHAIAVDDVRDIFGADASEAARLRAVAAERFGRPTPKYGLLGKLGPLFARPIDAPVIGPDTPGREDCDRLLAGQHVPPDRLAASWRLLEVWLEAKAWSSHAVTLDEHSLNAIEFDLGRAEIPVRYGVRSLVARELGIPLRTGPSVVAGYAPGHHVPPLAEAWRAALPGLEPETREWIGELLGWLDGFVNWTQAAEAEQRPRPDLVGIAVA